MSADMAPLPMTIYGCKHKDSFWCTLRTGKIPSGASEGLGDTGLVHCHVPDSPIEETATACDSVEITKTEIVARVTKGGMIT